MGLPTPPLLLITDRAIAHRPLCEVFAGALAGGCRWVLLREKDLDDRALADLAGELLALARPFGATVCIHGRAEVAAGCGAAGLHLPHGRDVTAARRRLGLGALLGVSAHSLAEARAGAEAGASYVTLSPIFPTISKPGYGPALGLEELGRIAGMLAIPVVALGGVTPVTAGSCLRAGAAGVAVLGTVMGSPDPARAVQELIATLEL